MVVVGEGVGYEKTISFFYRHRFLSGPELDHLNSHHNLFFK